MRPALLSDILHGRAPEADFVRHNSFGFLIGLIADQSVRVEVAWSLPYRLAERLGGLTPSATSSRTHEEIRQAIATKPALHRFPGVMAPRIQAAAERVMDTYGGNAAEIWRSGKSAAAVASELGAFGGIGPKKASLGAQMAMRDLGVDLQGSRGLDLAIDSHIRRVLHRYWGGLASDNDLRATARREVPSGPAQITPVTWIVGREWCRPRVTRCEQCPLTSDCAASDSGHRG